HRFSPSVLLLLGFGRGFSLFFGLRLLRSAGQDFCNPNRRLVLAVAALAAGILPAALLERDDCATAALFHHLGPDRRAFYQGRAEGGAVALAEGENLAELDGRAGFSGQPVD